MLTLVLLATFAQSLPAPSGRHAIGKTAFRWPDPREVAVQVWYPAAARQPGRATSVYLPGAPESLANLFGPSWPAIVGNQLRTHSVDNAPVARGGKLAVLIFSPGGGVPVAAYTIQMQDLASHGYVVAGVDHLDAPPGGKPEEVERKLTDQRAAEIRFVLDRLHAVNQDPKSPFHARLDLARVGAFGHSRGGRSSARACQLDARIKACLNQDGQMMWHPFWLDERGGSMQQPFMMLDHFDPDPPDELFRKMGTTRSEYAARRTARQAEAREKIYGTIAGGSYHVTIRTPGVSHNSFSDIRQLGRPDGSGINTWPEAVRATTPHARILGMIRSWTRAFFDQTVRSDPHTMDPLVRAADPDVEVRRYGPAR